MKEHHYSDGCTDIVERGNCNTAIVSNGPEYYQPGGGTSRSDKHRQRIHRTLSCAEIIRTGLLRLPGLRPSP